MTTKAEKKKIIQFNTISWMIAMLLPAVFYFALASTSFPWPIIYPLLLVGFLLNSNKVLERALDEPVEETVTE
jgi:hypothetical protein